MVIAVCVLLHCSDSTPTYSGRDHQLDVRTPRFEAEAVIDGDLRDSVWAGAARLTGFSQYAPNDDVPAADSTQVLVWYSATAIYFGIRAFERHGRPTMTLANRDQIFGDDNVQILLGTFHDGKQALMFAVNPVGVQGDGSLIEGANVTASGFIGGALVGREQPDLSPDFVFQSRGRVTDWGYEVEVRIPFKSIRYQPRQPQDWKLNIVREVQHSGFEDSWFPARRASATFIGQSGNLVGLSGMHRGLVMDLNPEATGKASGAPTPGGYQYDLGNPQLGGNIRWGVSDNLTLNGTIKPDFSQVESDAGQLAFDPRQALFFPEKRPFFLEGSELFQVPQNLIYTRRIVQPIAAVKLTGTSFGTDLGLLSAVDQKFASATGTENPLFPIVRAQKSLGRGSRVGLAYTDRIEGGDYNRVAEVDSRLVFKEIYGLNLQLAGSRTRVGGVTTTAPLWLSQFTVQHRIWGLRSLFAGIADQFRDASGFIGRAGIVHAYVDPSYTTYGGPGALLQRFTGDIVQIGTPQWKHFSGSGFFLQGHDENFFEWASGDLLLLSMDLSYRPTERLRNSVSYFWQQVNRRTDRSLVNVGRVLRAKVEYQVSRPLFVRVVGQYIQDKTDSLRDDSRTGAPILISGPGGLTRSAASHSNLFHADVLLSYQPVPGTVVFAGYGSDMVDQDAFRFRGLTRTDDAFFVKLSYLFRL